MKNSHKHLGLALAAIAFMAATGWQTATNVLPPAGQPGNYYWNGSEWTTDPNPTSIPFQSGTATGSKVSQTLSYSASGVQASDPANAKDSTILLSGASGVGKLTGNTVVKGTFAYTPVCYGANVVSFASGVATISTTKGVAWLCVRDTQ